MRFILLFLLSAVTLTASAQWYHIDLHLKKRERVPLMLQANDHSISRIRFAPLSKIRIHTFQLDRSDYSIEAAEAGVMKTAQHNMRFRIYADASYNFSELAKLYIQQNRFSEAKWYLLQSNIISRQQNDDKHTIANLIDLADIKANIGDYDLAQQDLVEAHDIAVLNVYKDELKAIEKETNCIKKLKLSPPKAELRYAEAAQNTGKTE